MEKEKIVDKIGHEWYEKIGDEFNKDYMKKIARGLSEARKSKLIYPDQSDVFRAYHSTPFHSVSVVILGQDPYNKGEANGLAFDCSKANYITPSMEKIQEIYDEDFPDNFATDILSGDLSRWARQGVLLLNSALTVPRGQPGKHTKHWEKFISATIEALIFDKHPKVFVLLGRVAQKYSSWITAPHALIEKEHPAAACYNNRKWDASGLFTEINGYLDKLGNNKIDW